MSDGISDGARGSDSAKLYGEYLRGLIRVLEGGGAIRRQRSLRDAAVQLDDELRIPANQGYAAKLTDRVSRLRAGDNAIWHALLKRCYAARCFAEYDQLLALSPFRGTVLLFVDHWKSGEVNLEGPFIDQLAAMLGKHRQHDDQYREQFLLALAKLPPLEPHQVSRLPRSENK